MVKAAMDRADSRAEEGPRLEDRHFALSFPCQLSTSSRGLDALLALSSPSPSRPEKLNKNISINLSLFINVFSPEKLH